MELNFIKNLVSIFPESNLAKQITLIGIRSCPMTVKELTQINSSSRINALNVFLYGEFVPYGMRAMVGHDARAEGDKNGIPFQLATDTQPPKYKSILGSLNNLFVTQSNANDLPRRIGEPKYCENENGRFLSLDATLAYLQKNPKVVEEAQLLLSSEKPVVAVAPTPVIKKLIVPEISQPIAEEVLVPELIFNSGEKG
jgi:hypothetical protein